MQAERLKILLQLIEDEPNDPFNYYAVAMEYLRNDPPKACASLEKIVVNFPDYLPTYYHLATLLAETNQQQDAETIFKRGIVLAEAQANNKALRELKSTFEMYKNEWEED